MAGQDTHKKSLKERYARKWVTEPWLFSGMVLAIVTTDYLLNKEKSYHDAFMTQAPAWIGAMTMFTVSPASQHYLGPVYYSKKTIRSENLDTYSEIWDNSKRFAIKYLPAAFVFIMANSASMLWPLEMENPETHQTLTFPEALERNAPFALAILTFLTLVYPTLIIGTTKLTEKAHNLNALTNKEGDGKATKFARNFGKAYTAVNINFMPAMGCILLLANIYGSAISGKEFKDVWMELRAIWVGATSIKLSGTLPLMFMGTERMKEYVSQRFFGKTDEPQEGMPLFATAAGSTINNHNGGIEANVATSSI